MKHLGRSIPFAACALTALCLALIAPAQAGAVDAHQAFDQLRSLAGNWQGTPEGEGERAAAEAAEIPAVRHEIKVSAAGTVVMETMGPGTPYEMINMYHLDGDDLVLTHYCSGGNQPTMRLDRDQSTASHLVFAFAGGSNLDPAVDEHIHGAEITLVDADHLDSSWTARAGGEPAGVMIFHLARTK